MTEEDPIVEIRDLAHGGAGVGRAVDSDESRVWFVEGALPGERVRVALDAEHKRWLRGHVLEVLTPAPERVEPPCPIADRCGGCSWQHVDPAAQARFKARIVAGQLRRVVDFGERELVSVPSPRPLGYRRRARVHYRRDPQAEGGLVLGFFGHRSREIVDNRRCIVLEPALDWAIQQVRRWVEHLPASGEIHGLCSQNPPAQPRRGGASPQGGDDLRGGAENQVVLGLPGVRHSPELEAAIRELIDAGADEAGTSPRLVGVQLRGGRERVGIGRTSLELDAHGPLPPVVQGPFTFSQAQTDQNAKLVEYVAQMARSQDCRVLELHAGVGNFSRALARSARRVWTVDGDREAVASLQRSVERWGLSINVKRGQAESVVAKLAAGKRHYDVIVCDPPRSGVGEQAARDMARVATRRIVYVSCDPATLARDLAAMKPAFEVAELMVFDMMPMTAEVEVVAVLAARGETPRATSLGLSAEGFVAETGSTSTAGDEQA